MNKAKLINYILILSLLGNIGFLLYFLFNHDVIKSAKNVSSAQEFYPLLSKRIHSEFRQDIVLNFLELRTSLRKQVAPYKNTFGFYFEYLPTGTTIGVNEKTEFYAASLFKVPVVMAYYHYKERLNLKDDPTLEIKEEHIDKNFGDLWKKGIGAKIKASEAVRLTLVESDNTAVKLLAPFIKEEDFNAVYLALDVDLKSDEAGALISAKNYSSILKALYFSSVLSKESSNEILDMLTKTKFPDKIEAGVPHGILVAHKIGDFEDKKGVQGFRDCGIVYVPRRPYILCMFSVSDEHTARQRMKVLSKTVYDFVSKVK